jgi:hypothetical protein
MGRGREELRLSRSADIPENLDYSANFHPLSNNVHGARLAGFVDLNSGRRASDCPRSAMKGKLDL